MSGHINQNYRWSDKPVHLKQAILIAILGLLILVLVVKLKGKEKAAKVRAFTRATKERSNAEVQNEMEKNGILPPLVKIGNAPLRGGGTIAQSGKPGIRIHERPLFDGLIATLEVRLSEPIATSTEGNEAIATVVRIIPDEVLSDQDGDIVKNAKLLGQYQGNFESKRISFRFSELIAADGKHYAVSGVAMDPTDSVLGVLANYSSGAGSRVIGAAINEVVVTGQQYGTSRILADPNNHDATLIAAMNRPITDSGNRAATSVGEELTHDLKGKKPVLSLEGGSRFLVKLKALPQGEEKGP